VEDEVRKRLRPLALQATAAERAEKLAVEIAGLRARVAELDLEAIAERRAATEERRDVSMLAQVLLLEARVLRRTGDDRSRAVLAAAADELVEMGGVRAAALARRDLGLIELEHGELEGARERLLQALPVLLYLDRAAAAAAVGALAALTARADDAVRAKGLAAAASALRSGGVAISTEDGVRLDSFLAEVGPFPVSVTGLDDDALLEMANGNKN